MASLLSPGLSSIDGYGFTRSFCRAQDSLLPAAMHFHSPVTVAACLCEQDMFVAQ